MWNGVPFLASPIDTLMLDQSRAVISLVVFVRQTFHHSFFSDLGVSVGPTLA
jgi:hypothetical protein